MSDLEYPTFALFAYSGAALWASTFIALGYLLGERWKVVQQNIDQYLVGGVLAAVILAVGVPGLAEVVPDAASVTLSFVPKACLIKRTVHFRLTKRETPIVL